MVAGKVAGRHVPECLPACHACSSLPARPPERESETAGRVSPVSPCVSPSPFPRLFFPQVLPCVRFAGGGVSCSLRQGKACQPPVPGKIEERQVPVLESERERGEMGSLSALPLLCCPLPLTHAVSVCVSANREETCKAVPDR